MTAQNQDSALTHERDQRHCELVARLCRQDERALGELYDELSPRVYALALRVVGRVQIAEEVVEDTFFQVWREAVRFDEARGRALTWILTICRSRALDALRRADPAESVEDPDLLRADDEASMADPAYLLEQFEAGSSVHRALGKLPAKERQLVSLAFFRGLTHQEIAEAWHLPLGTVKTHLRRAVEMLRVELRDDRESLNE